MKRLQRVLAMVLLLALVLTGIPAVPVAAEEIPTSGTCGDSVTWEVTGTTLVISGTGAMNNYTADTQPWKKYRGTITSVVVEKDVTSLGKYAFCYCRNLKEISLPTTVTTISRYAFFQVSSLTDVYYAGSAAQWELVTKGEDNDSFTSARTYMESGFGICGAQLRWVVFSGTLTISGQGAMTNYTRTEQPWKAFRGIIKEIVIEEGVTSLGKYAFSYCSKLTTITMPVSVTSLGNYVTFQTSGITDVYYNGTQEQWEQISFGTGNTALTDAQLHAQVNDEVASGSCGDAVTWSLSRQGVLTISGEGAMADFTRTTQPWKAYRNQIKTIVVKEGVTTIGKNAFYYSKYVTSITIPETVSKIAAYATLSCTKLAEVNYASSRVILDRILVVLGNDRLLNAETINTVEPVDTELKLTAEPTKLIYEQGEELDLTGMELTLVNSMGKEISVKEGYIVYGYDKTSLTTQEITVIYKGLYTCFSVNVRATGDCGADGSEVSYCVTDGKLTISGTGAMKDYGLNKDIFKSYRKIVKTVVIEEGITTVGRYALEYLSRVGTVYLPLSLTSIRNAGFFQCNKINNVFYAGTAYQWSKVSVAANNEDSIGDAEIKTATPKAVSISITEPTKKEYVAGETLDLTGLTITITYNDGNTRVVDGSDTDSYKLSTFYPDKPVVQTLTVTYANRLTASFQVSVVASGTCEDGMEWTIDEGVLTISGEGAMMNYSITTQPWKKFRSSINAAVFADGITQIGKYALCSCTNLTSVTIPASVTKIGNNTAFQTDNITDVYYGGSEARWAKVSMGTGNTSIVNATIHYAEAGEPELTGIAVTAPSKNTYWVGEELDLTGMSVTATYSDDTTEVITAGYTVTGYDANTAGQQTVTVTYEGFTATFAVTVNEIVLVGITVTPPTKTDYAYGEVLNLDGMQVIVNWSDGRTEEVADGYTVEGFDANTPGEQIITVTYEGFTATFTVTVEAAPVVLIGIYVTAPDKTEYAWGEMLDLTGMTVTGNYSDGSSHGITEGYIVTGFDPEVVGQQWVSVTYEGCSMSFSVTVAAPALTGITVTAPSKNTYWVGEELDLTDMVVTATYADGSTETVLDGYTVEGYDAYTAGEQTVTVTYEGFTATFAVTVNEIVLAGIAVTPPAKTRYAYGEGLDCSGMKVIAKWSDGRTEVVADGYTVEGYDAYTPGVQTITVIYQGFGASFSVIVERFGMLVMEQITATPGETVEVKLNLANNPGIASARLKLAFDTTVLTLTKVEDGGILGTAEHKPELTSPYTLCWANDLATENFTETGVLVTLTFTVAADAPAGEYPITMSYSDTNGHIMDTDLKDVPFQAINGSVTVQDDGSAKLVLDSVSGAAGEIVEVKLNIKNNPGVAAAKLKLAFDSTVLTLTEVTDGGILGNAVHKPELTNPYTLCWENDLATENFTADGTLVTLRFAIAEDAPAGEYAITMSYGTTNGDIMDVDLNDVPMTAVQGKVTVTQ